MTNRTFRWGILGTGAIASAFAEGLRLLPNVELHAVGSRSSASAERFAKQHGASHAYGSYEELARDDRVDAVYVATPHVRHCQDTLLCLDAGRAVLCEKPFAMNRAEGERMVAAARAAGLFLMEAMWTRFLPATRLVRETISKGEIGELRGLSCDFGFRAPFDAGGRLFDPQLGGGALLDVGIYCVSYARMLFGQAPSDIRGLAQIGETGVDEDSSWVFRYPDGRLAQGRASVRIETSQEALIYGSDGRLRLPSFWEAREVIFEQPNGESRTVPAKPLGKGYAHEAQEVMERLAAKELESPVMPLAESLELLGTLDLMRSQWDLRYPSDGRAVE